MARVGQNCIYTVYDHIPGVYPVFGDFPARNTVYIGLAKTVYIRCIYGILCREITKYTVSIYGSGQPYKKYTVWPTLHMA